MVTVKRRRRRGRETEWQAKIGRES